MSSTAEETIGRLFALTEAIGLPGVAIGAHYGTPSLGVAGKQFAGWRDGALSLRIPMEQKEFLLDVAPEIYFETDHYKGWPAVLARLSALSDEELVHRVGQAWRAVAPKKLMAGLEARPSKATSKKQKR